MDCMQPYFSYVSRVDQCETTLQSAACESIATSLPALSLQSSCGNGTSLADAFGQMFPEVSVIRKLRLVLRAKSGQ